MKHNDNSQTANVALLTVHPLKFEWSMDISDPYFVDSCASHKRQQGTASGEPGTHELRCEPMREVTCSSSPVTEGGEGAGQLPATVFLANHQ